MVFELAWLTDYFVCIPFRTHLNPKNGFCYRFKHSARAQTYPSGLDYQKIVIIQSHHIAQQAVVDKDEFNEVRAKMAVIQKEAIDFIEIYIAHITGTKLLHPREFSRRYRFSTLAYFHAELGLP